MSSEWNDYKVYIGEQEEKVVHLILDVITHPDFKKNAFYVQAFFSADRTGCQPGPMFFDGTLNLDEMHQQVFIDSLNHIKGVELWGFDFREISLSELKHEHDFLLFVRGNCKSQKLAVDIDELKLP